MARWFKVFMVNGYMNHALYPTELPRLVFTPIPIITTNGGSVKGFRLFSLIQEIMVFTDFLITFEYFSCVFFDSKKHRYVFNGAKI